MVSLYYIFVIRADAPADSIAGVLATGFDEKDSVERTSVIAALLYYTPSMALSVRYVYG